MLDKMGDEIDAVAISTPDHTHFAVAMAAMERGKHVFVQKPLAHNIWQCRTLRKAARHYKVITQMGNQGHTFEGMRRIKEWVDAGIIGEVTEVITWTNRPNPPWFIPPESRSRPPTGPVPDDPRLGPLAGAGRRRRDYSQDYVPDPLARLVGLRLRLARRHRLPHLRRAVLGARPRLADQGRGRARGSARRGLHPDEFGGDLPLPGPRRQAAGDPEVVREGLRGARSPGAGTRTSPSRTRAACTWRAPRRRSSTPACGPTSPKITPADRFMEMKGAAAQDRAAAPGGRGPDRGVVRAIKGDGPAPGSQLRLRRPAHRDGAARRPRPAHRQDDRVGRRDHEGQGPARARRLVKEPVREGWSYGENL